MNKNELKGNRIKLDSGIYVSKLSDITQHAIREALYESIKVVGIYTNEEMKDNVQRGMDSKIVDLTDTINVYDIIEQYKN